MIDGCKEEKKRKEKVERIESGWWGSKRRGSEIVFGLDGDAKLCVHRLLGVGDEGAEAVEKDNGLAGAKHASDLIDEVLQRQLFALVVLQHRLELAKVVL